MKILVSSICFINHNKLKAGSQIYATFANRLIKSAMEFTPFDFRLATNEPDLFKEALETWPDRFSLLVDKLEHNQVQVGPFNQLLKFFALKNIPQQYDYVLYLDCDAGFRAPINMDIVEKEVQLMESEGYNGMVNRAHTEYLMQCLTEHEQFQLPGNEGKKNMFSHKFRFYNITSENIPVEWTDATLPCEHILFLKNESDRLQRMSDKISEFNDKLEIQVNQPYIECASDMEAFEIGISAKLAGYKFQELNSYHHHDVFQVTFNGSNWEKIKL